MSLVHDKDNYSSIYLNNNDFVSSLELFQKVERRISAKKITLDDIKNELDLLMKQAFNTYRSEVRYIYIGEESVWEDAKKWLHMLTTGEDNDGNKLDKRKKYPEKSTFEYLQSTLGNLLGIENFKIDNIIDYNYGEAVFIEFSYLDHNWHLSIPFVNNIKMRSYEAYGAYCFKISLSIYVTDYSTDNVGSTFEENELKDILQLGIEKYCNTKNEDS